MPDLLTLLRIPLAGFVWVVIERPLWTGALMVLAGLSDLLDGWLARRVRADVSRSETNHGAWLDPLCDKVFMVSLAVATYWSRRPPWLLVLLVLSRDILEAPLALAYAVVWAVSVSKGRGRRYDFTAGAAGKATTVFQFVTVGLLLLRWPGAWFSAVGAAGCGSVAVAVYARRGWRVGSVDASNKGKEQ